MVSRCWNQDPPANKLVPEQSLSSGTFLIHLGQSVPMSSILIPGATNWIQGPGHVQSLANLRRMCCSPSHFSQSHQKPVARQPCSQMLRSDSSKLQSPHPSPVTAPSARFGARAAVFFQLPLFQASSPWSVLNIHLRQF